LSSILRPFRVFSSLLGLDKDNRGIPSSVESGLLSERTPIAISEIGSLIDGEVGGMKTWHPM
jgi:hypothetical protein